MLDSRPKKIVVSKDGQKIFVTDTKNHRVIVILKTGENFSVVTTFQLPNSNNILPDGIIIDDKNHLFVANSSGSEIFAFDTLSGQLLKTISLQDNNIVRQQFVGPKNLLFYKNGQIEKIYVTGFDSSVISVIDNKNLSFIKNIPLFRNTSQDSYNPVGISLVTSPSKNELIYVTNASGRSISIIDPITDTLLRNISDVESIALQKPLGEIVTIGAGK